MAAPAHRAVVKRPPGSDIALGVALLGGAIVGSLLVRSGVAWREVVASAVAAVVLAVALRRLAAIWRP